MPIILDEINILLLITACLNIFLGVIILSTGKNQKINIVYGLNIAVLTCWVLVMSIYRSAPEETALFWTAILYAVPTFIASSFLYFTYIFPQKDHNKFFREGLIIFLINIIVVIITVWPGLMIKDIVIVPGHEKEILFTDYYWFYFIYTISFFFFGFYRLIKKYRSCLEEEHLQIKYLLIGYILAANIAFITNLTMPWLGYYSLNWLGSIMTVFIVSFTIYAILKHHLFDIKVIVTEFLIVLLWAFMFGRALIAPSFQDKMIEAGLLFITIILGTFLIRSVIKEIESRERTEMIAIQLKRANEEKEEFMSFASHELRTPLTVIKGYSSMMLEGDFGKLDPRVRDSIQLIQMKSNEALGLIGQYLSKSRMELGQMSYNFVVLDLEKLTRSLVNDFQHNAEQEKIEFYYTTDNKKSYMINADEGKIKEVVGNLLDNAIKYTPKGSVKIHLSRTDEKILIKISDTGVGISPEGHAQLFKKFSRLKVVQKTGILGTGLGLYLAHVFITAHGGRIWAESKGVGLGSTFYVEFEAIKETPASS